jgi:hypothetical protein
MKLTKTQLKRVIKEELERLQREALDPRKEIKGDPPYVIEHVGAKHHERYLVKFVNTGDGYETVWGPYDEDAWRTADKMKALSMQHTTEDRTGYQTTISAMG